MFSPRRVQPSHEDIFLERYDKLLAWARQIVGGDREAAEDLVHDAFVNFTISRPDHIDNVDGYLFTTLRNLHLANLRRSAQRRDTQLPLVEYESAVDTLHALIPARVHDEMAAICDYARRRRLTSKAGSVLILRFFHGYRAAEVARVIKLSPDAVDNLLRIGRREARVWLQDPQRLRFIERTGTAPLPPVGFGDPSNLLRDLQAAIFDANQSPCPGEQALRACYDALDQPLDCQRLAHIVACRRCLDTVNRMLDLPCLADRNVDDGLGPGRRPPRGSSGAGSAGSADEGARRKVRRRADDVLRKKPTTLRVAANGQELGGQEVSGGRASLHLLVHTLERLGFVEILDEAGERLVLMNTEPPPEGAAEQSAQVAFSGGRQLAVRVSFAGAWPTIAVFYEESEARHELPEHESENGAVHEPRHPPLVRARWWLAGLLQAGRRRRRLIAALATVFLLIALARRGEAWSAVVHVKQLIAEWVQRLITDGRPRAGLHPEELRVERRSDIELPGIVSPRNTPVPAPRPRGLAPAALRTLFVDVVERLDRVDALYGEALTVQASDDGFLRLQGLVDDDTRRRTVLDAMGALTSVPQFSIDLRIPSAEPRPAGAQVLKAIAVPQNRSAVYDALGGASQEAAARELAIRVVDASERALRHTWAVSRLVRQTPVGAGDTADINRRWRALLARHVDGFIAESADLERALVASGLLPAADALDANGGATLALDEAAARLVSLATAQDRTIRALFVATPASTDVDVTQSLSALALQLRSSVAFAQQMLER